LEKKIEHKMRVLIYSATLPAKFLILRTIQRDIIINNLSQWPTWCTNFL